VVTRALIGRCRLPNMGKPKAMQSAPRKQHTKPTDVASTVSVYDGETYLGSIRIGGRGDAVAYSADGKRIGSFPSERAAMAAFKKAAE
jgi:hypothetical protein